jgi:N-acetylmuramoyl-L-alanine amidase
MSAKSIVLRLLWGLICLVALAPAALGQPSVTGVRVGEHPDKTRFVMELSETPRYRVFTLADPFRVVIDLPELQWSPAAALGRETGLIEAMRFGLFAPGTSRVVLDVTAPVRVNSVFLIPPSEGYPVRFVVDMVRVSRAAYDAGRGRPPLVSDPPLAPLRAAVIAPPPPKVDERPLVIIDPGHGGVDPGSRSITGVDEKRISLDYARELKKQLEATGRYRVALTRNKDIFLRLRDRMEVGQRLGGGLFVSLHANNHESPKIRGASIYTLSEKASDAEAEALAAKENKADVIAGIDLSEQTEVVSKILIDLAQRETMNLSKQFANILVPELGKVTALLGKPHRFAGFAVLKSPTVPSVLVEIGYLSNRAEERLLRSADYRSKVMGAMLRAIDAYFAKPEVSNRS